MERNDKDEQELFDEGQYCLDMIGLGHLADQPMTYRGATMQVRNFLDICGEQARPYFAGLETLSDDDPVRDATVQLLRAFVFNYVQPSADK